MRMLFPLIAGMALAGPAMSGEYLLAPIRPDKLVVVDAGKMAVDKVIELPAGSGPMAAVPVVSPDGRTAYVNVNRTESLLKVDLMTGETLARVDMSTDDERVKSLFGVALSPDGATLAVYQSPVRMLASEFQVQPTRIALYDTATMTLRSTFPAPRQITLMAWSTDGSRIFGLGRDLYSFDPASGEQLEAQPVHSWRADDYTLPDVLAVWSQYETSNRLVTPFYMARKDGAADDPETFRTGLLTLDLDSGQLDMRDVRAMDVFYFSTASNPDRTRIYGAYNVLESFDAIKGEPIRRVSLPHSYYSVNVSHDGSTVWLGGALSDLAAYDAETLEKKGQVDLPGGVSMSLSSVRMFQRDDG
ncbi:MAG: quinohemoprotein amine dehydrogenase subunit beta [Paracoccus sp. (in: a-proteobacteria)]|uniref:quinohemoprotein amine dehydrogenase subunit beta n=1 Tax=Paracoccus sp. TaxID=267 RepID=UPI0026DEE8E2|nr:quinohemoprotein amine dehydrogenase subunit beta [Paracoccus sp. (in: a-proteobacteria)]MDO5620015.1 quinohemoprotein amine dehydrogenase subunit beta [Paracoccus sp. (in: a-proteobacteria)]